MKNIFLLLFAFSFSQFVHSQSVSIDCPNFAEVGVDKEFEATFTFSEGTADDYTILKYQWSVPFNGEGISGPLGINGNLNGGTNEPLNIQSSSFTNSITVRWGDFFDVCDDEVSVVVFYRFKNEPDEVSTTCSIDIKCITTPSITGPNSIQNCCTNTITYCDVSGGNQNVWLWSVSGGTLTSGQGTSCIDVQPNNTGNVTATCTVSRSNGNPAYVKTNSRTTTRTTPQTPPISGPNYVCQGESETFCINNSLCGISSISWNIPNSFSIVSGQGTSCITIIPNSNVPNGTVATLNATANFNGGCSSSSSLKDVSIFTDEMPPCPIGQPIIIFEDGYDPCDDENTYLIKYSTNFPYTNGITTISPAVIIDVPHHNVDGIIDVTVCNVNLCSGLKCCVEYTVYLPYPCEPNEFEIKGRNDIDESVDIKISPNPAQNFVFLESSKELDGQLIIYNAQGKKVMQQSLDKESSIHVDVSEINISGIYYMLIQSGKESFIKKLVLNK